VPEEPSGWVGSASSRESDEPEGFEDASESIPIASGLENGPMWRTGGELSTGSGSRPDGRLVWAPGFPRGPAAGFAGQTNVLAGSAVAGSLGCDPESWAP
jgi:hypothetical protein